MERDGWICLGILLLSFFIGAVSQVLLKKSAQKSYKTRAGEYLNPLVITAYLLFVITTLFSVFAYRKVPLSLGAVLETTSYIYITFFGVAIFGERMNKKKALALVIIILGIIVSVLP